MKANVAERERALAGRPQSAIVATTISLGTQHRYFESALGIEFGTEEHRFAAGSHALPKADDQRLFEVVTNRSDSEPDFWPVYVGRATAAGDRLLTTARSVASLAATSCDREVLLQGFIALMEVMREMSPVVVATPTVVAVLTSQVSDRLGDEAGESAVSGILPRLLTPWREPDPMGDMHDGYQIALDHVDNVVKIIRGSSRLFTFTLISPRPVFRAFFVSSSINFSNLF